MTNVIDKTDLPDGGEFEGYRFGKPGFSFIWVELEPGRGPKLHRHEYPEVFVVIEGHAIYTLGEETIEVTGGQVVIAPAGVPHAFVNTGPGVLRQIDIHAGDRFATDWPEDGDRTSGTDA